MSITVLKTVFITGLHIYNKLNKLIIYFKIFLQIKKNCMNSENIVWKNLYSHSFFWKIQNYAYSTLTNCSHKFSHEYIL